MCVGAALGFSSAGDDVGADVGLGVGDVLGFAVEDAFGVGDALGFAVDDAFGFGVAVGEALFVPVTFFLLTIAFAVEPLP